MQPVEPLGPNWPTIETVEVASALMVAHLQLSLSSQLLHQHTLLMERTLVELWSDLGVPY